MIKFGALIKDLATKAAVDVEKDSFIKLLLANQEVSNMDVPDEVANAFQNNLLTEASAGSNANVRAKLRSEALDGIDKQLKDLVEKGAFSDTFKAAFKAETNTGKKISMVQDEQGRIHTEALKAAQGNPNPDTSKKQSEIDNLTTQNKELNQKLTDFQKLYDTDIAAKNQELADKDKGYVLDGNLARRTYPKNGMDHDINTMLAKQIVQGALLAQGFDYVLDAAGKPQLQMKDSSGAWVPAFLQNKPVNLDEFITSTLASKKLVPTTDPQPTPGPGAPPVPAGTPPNPQNAAVVAEIEKTISTMPQTA